MSSVGVLIEKKSKCFRERREKNKCPMKKFSKCEERGRKNVSVEFRVFEKKMKEKFRGKKSKCFGGKKKLRFSLW